MFGLGVNRLGATNQKPFSPASLFNNGEAGVWYDPSAASGSLDWRKNLLEYTESFDNSYWNLDGNQLAITRTPNAAISPDGTNTATKIIGNSTSKNPSTAYIGKQVSSTKHPYVCSIYAKASEYNYLVAGVGSYASGFWGVFNLQTGQVHQQPTSGSTAAYIEDAGNGWYRCWLVETSAASSEMLFVAPSVDGTRTTNYTSTTSGIYIWGAQVEEASTASSYQPILSTFESAFKAAFPSHTLYQDYQGVTPVTAVGQPVGLMLDKSEGLAQGPELVTNGDFATDSDWAIAGAAAASNISNNVAYIESGGANAYLTQQLTGLVAGKSYQISFNLISKVGAGIAYLRVAGLDVAATSLYGLVGEQSYIFIAGSGSQELRFMTYALATSSFTIDNVSVTEIQGSHATQPTSTKRPIYARHPEGGIRNLLNYTEQFDNGYWTKFAGATASGTTINLPVTDDRVYRNYTPLSNTAYTYSAILSGSGTVTLHFKMGGINAETQVTLTATPTKHSFTVTTTSTVSGNVFIRKRNSDTATTLTCDGVQLEEATEASNYQKVVTDIDVTESGVGEVYYLKFDGVDDGMLINNLTSSSTPLTALFGYSATNAESSSYRYLLDIQAGRTVFGKPNSVNTLGYYDGDEPWAQFTANSNAIKVLTYDLIEDDAKIRIDGTQEYSDTLYVPRAIGGQISIFQSYTQVGAYLGGNMYQTILRAAESTDEEIAKAETYVANKTGLKAQVDGIATLDLNFGNNTYTAKNSNGGVI